MKTFLLFVALICATTMATPLPPTTASGEPLSAFLASLKQGLENLLAMVNRFENGQSTQIDQSMTRILVVTGVNSASGPTSTYTTKTELWPKPDSQCSLHDFPLEVEGAVGIWTAQGPTVCGGNGGENKCFLYRGHQWMPWTNIGTARSDASAIQINPNQTLIIGGNDENGNDLKTTELISSSGSEEGNIPVTIWGHCSFPINATHGMVTGGLQDESWSANAWYVDLTTTRVTPGPTMKTGRRGHGCATFQHGTKSYGIVAGGYNDYGGVDGKLDSTEMIDMDQESPSWTEGPKLPRKLRFLTLVETSQGTYAMGGWNGRNSRTEVLQLDCPGDQISSCQWKEVGNLQFARYNHVSIPVPESYDICN